MTDTAKYQRRAAVKLRPKGDYFYSYWISCTNPYELPYDLKKFIEFVLEETESNYFIVKVETRKK